MSADSIITMVIVLGGVWGGFAALMVRAARAEKRRGESHSIIR
jgi:hypothetical protein